MIEVQPSPADSENTLFQRIRRFSVQEYHRWITSGMLTSDDPVELLEGIIVEKMPVYPSHRFVTDEIRKRLDKLGLEGYFVTGQQPITLSESEPEPDVFIVRGHSREFLQNHPGPREVPLVVEVSDSTLASDRREKKRIYARAGIPVYWIVNLNERQLEVYTEPLSNLEQPTYRNQTIYTDKEFFPVIIGDQELGQINMVDILP